ncbi:unnamed protein product [Bursaphelenchus okinawaensis]|uniref:Uncharacterized protein n=1 Tax=Bursaphelenchus okinawaensis TaxID=465554 RepID=A0A811KCI5_9BILA|nr:unnamed protein product [Bursaphelenchus okinawaensis]CAG9100982.1 unnamed protein product [Bursaphelenchus okinawaensis]
MVRPTLILLLATAALLTVFAHECRVKDYPIVLELSKCTKLYTEAFSSINSSRLEFILIGKPADLGDSPLVIGEYISAWDDINYNTKLGYETNTSKLYIEYYDRATETSRKTIFEKLDLDDENENMHLFLQLFQGKIVYGMAHTSDNASGLYEITNEDVHRLEDIELYNLYTQLWYEDVRQYMFSIKSEVPFEMQLMNHYWINRDLVDPDVIVPHLIPLDLMGVDVYNGWECVWCWIAFILALFCGLCFGSSCILFIAFSVYKKKANDLNDQRIRAIKNANKKGKSGKSEKDGPPGSSRTGSDTNLESNKSKSKKGKSKKGKGKKESRKDSKKDKKNSKQDKKNSKKDKKNSKKDKKKDGKSKNEKKSKK